MSSKGFYRVTTDEHPADLTCDNCGRRAMANEYFTAGSPCPACQPKVYERAERTKSPDQLEVGECFSYPGSFKIYKVVTKPEIDPAFNGKQKCTNCGHDYLPFCRLKFRVTDEGTQGELPIRLRSDVVCTIHTDEELAQQVKESAIRCGRAPDPSQT